MNERFYGVETRTPYPSESQFFTQSPHVAGMAAEDGRIVMNPNMAQRPRSEYEAVARNEALRSLFRANQIPRPNFELSDSQRAAFGRYSEDPQDIRETLVARWLTNDPSGGYPEKRNVNYLTQLMQLLEQRR